MRRSTQADSFCRNPVGIICNYDEPERGEKRKRGAGGVTKIQSLEAKIGTLADGMEAKRWAR